MNDVPEEKAEEGAEATAAGAVPEAVAAGAACASMQFLLSFPG